MNQKEYIGAGAIGAVRDVLKKYSGRNVFLVTGKSSYSASGAEQFLSDVLCGYNLVRFNDFNVDPNVEDVARGVSVMKEADADIVVAVGGGSVMDLAKLVNFFSVNDMDESDPSKVRGNVRKSKPLIAIATTAGSGSESTHFAVVYKGHDKYSVAYECILPDIALVDSNLMRSLSGRQVAISGMDALCQAVEAYWSVGSTDESKTYSKEAIELILPNFASAVNDRNESSLECMAKAAHLAGKAINIAKTTAPHAISYAITSFYNVPHGHAVALTLGKCFVINSRLGNAALNESRGGGYLRETMRDLESAFDCSSAEEFSKKWYNLMVDVGLECDPKKIGICDRTDVERMVGMVNIERLSNNPVKMSDQQLRQLLS